MLCAGPLWGGGQTFYVVGCAGHDDVDEVMYASEANFLVSEVSKFSAGSLIFRGP